MKYRALRIGLAIGLGLSTTSCAWLERTFPNGQGPVTWVEPTKWPGGMPPPQSMEARQTADGRVVIAAQAGGAAPTAQAPAPVVVAQVPAAPVVQVAQAPVALVAPAAPVVAAAAAPVQAAPAIADEAVAVRQTIESWRGAWEKGDAQQYLTAYVEGFKGDAGNAKVWQAQRKQRLANGNITVKFTDMEVRMQTGEATARFTQVYRSQRYQDEGEKTLRLRRIDGQWRIDSERFTPRSA